MKECMVCLEEITDYVVLPCSHELCVLCYPLVQQAFAKCPLCQNPLIFNEPDYAVYGKNVERCANAMICTCIALCIAGVYVLVS
jgi:hypothetical protein